MIGRISGVLVSKIPPQVLIDVRGVAYEVDVPMSTFYNLPLAGAEVMLFTHLVVREDPRHQGTERQHERGDHAGEQGHEQPQLPHLADGERVDREVDGARDRGGLVFELVRPFAHPPGPRGLSPPPRRVRSRR